MSRPIVGAHADFRPSDYRFERQRQDDTPLEQCPPMESLAELVVGWGIIAVAAFAVIRILMFIFEVLRMRGFLVMP